MCVRLTARFASHAIGTVFHTLFVVRTTFGSSTKIRGAILQVRSNEYRRHVVLIIRSVRANLQLYRMSLAFGNLPKTLPLELDWETGYLLWEVESETTMIRRWFVRFKFVLSSKLVFYIAVKYASNSFGIIYDCVCMYYKKILIMKLNIINQYQMCCAVCKICPIHFF